MIWVFDQEVEIDWANFTFGSSFFVPCIDRADVEVQIKKACRDLGIRCVTKQVLEQNMYGVRAWRR